VSSQSQRILLVDDEQSVQTLLSYPLRSDGYDVVCALDGEEALRRFGESSFDLVVLDVMLPHLDGFEVCRQLRAKSGVPIIMLTARDDEFDKVLGLELGADDYITKPFSIREFRSRVKAMLRRAEMTPVDDRGPAPIEVGGLRIDLARRTVQCDGGPVQLTYVEFEVLAVLARSPGRVFGRSMILEHALGDAQYRDPRTVDVHVRHLREKIERDPRSPQLILTARGVGYFLQER
jgi:DNA-binding response OmpR family regulator